MGALAGKSAFITGGSSGIGLAIAKAFIAEGADVLISGRRRSALVEALGTLGAAARGVSGDIADLDFHDRAAAEIEQFGGLDIYVANAGINTIRHSSEVSPAEFDEQFAVNTRGTFFGVQKTAPLVRDDGAIVIVGSLATHKVLDGHAVYAGSKAALGAFARSWALELKNRRIRVNLLSPGPTNTAIIDKLGVAPERREEFVGQMAAAIPMGRLGEAQEIARAALFLASPASSFITGVDLRADGGMALL